MTDHSGERVGTLAEELAKLMGVVSGLAEKSADGGTDAHSHGAHAESGRAHTTDHASAHTPPIADDSAACQVCPVCQAIAFVRSTSPEVREHLASSAASLAAAARGLLDGMTAPPAQPDERASRVENINVSEDEKWD